MDTAITLDTEQKNGLGRDECGDASADDGPSEDLGYTVYHVDGGTVVELLGASDITQNDDGTLDIHYPDGGAKTFDPDKLLTDTGDDSGETSASEEVHKVGAVAHARPLRR